MEIKLVCPEIDDLARAIRQMLPLLQLLAESPAQGTLTDRSPSTVAPRAPVVDIPAATVAAAPPAAPITTTPTTPAVVPPAPTAPTVVPTAAAPAYTLDQVATAAANLRSTSPGVMPQLFALLGQMGVKSLPELPAEKLGEFATALRGLGAKI